MRIIYCSLLVLFCGCSAPQEDWFHGGGCLLNWAKMNFVAEQLVGPTTIKPDRLRSCIAEFPWIAKYRVEFQVIPDGSLDSWRVRLWDAHSRVVHEMSVDWLRDPNKR